MNPFRVFSGWKQSPRVLRQATHSNTSQWFPLQKTPRSATGTSMALMSSPDPNLCSFSACLKKSNTMKSHDERSWLLWGWSSIFPLHRLQQVLVSVNHMRVRIAMLHDNTYQHPTLLSLDGGTRGVLEWSYMLVVISVSLSSIKALNGHKFRSGKDLNKCHINFLKTQLCHCKVTHITITQK